LVLNQASRAGEIGRTSPCHHELVAFVGTIIAILALTLLAPLNVASWDDSMLINGAAEDVQHVLPPSPNHPVGALWMELGPVKGFEAHIGIHGMNGPTHIGNNHSSGCIRLATWGIVRLAGIVGPGTRVAWTKCRHIHCSGARHPTHHKPKDYSARLPQVAVFASATKIRRLKILLLTRG
jgi:hypothetical protein